MCNPKAIIIPASTSNRNLTFSFQCRTIQVEDVFPYIDCCKYNELCKIGCINYEKKWSCPPFTPSYNQYIKNYINLSLCVLSINLSQFSYIKNDYLKVKAANVILKSRIDKTLRSLSQDGVGYISTGSCRLCKPCKCKTNENCAKPDSMSYSFEALGVDVGSMVMGIFHHQLLWYKKSALPEYTTVVAGLLSNEIDCENILTCTLRGLS